MQFPSPVAITWIAELINAKLIGDNTAFATGINEIHHVQKGDLVFVDHPKYYDKCINSNASFIIINKETAVPDGKTLLITDEPFEAYCKIVNHFRPFKPAHSMVSGTALVGEGTFIYHSAFVGENVRIGKNCIIYPHVGIMDNTIIGDNVIIQNGTIIGSDAFYYNTKKDRDVWYKKMPACGSVIIESDVEIGANCTIDRGISTETIIGRGTKMDNLIHIGHDTKIGHNCLFAAGTVVAGGVNIGNGVTVWGQCVINKTLSIGDNAVLLGRTGVGSSLEGNKTYWGAPAQEAGVVKREMIWVKRIPEMWEKLKNL